MGRLVVEEALPVGVWMVVAGDSAWLFGAVTMLGLLDLRFEPKPRFLNREFIRSMCFSGASGFGEDNARPLRVPFLALCVRRTQRSAEISQCGRSS